MLPWQRRCFLAGLLLQLSRSETTGCLYSIYPPPADTDRCKGQPLATYTVQQHVCTILEGLPYGFHYQVHSISPDDRSYYPDVDKPCDFSNGAIISKFDNCFWWQMALNRTQWGITCLNDTNVKDSDISPTLARTSSISFTLTTSTKTLPTTGLRPAMTSSSTIKTSAQISTSLTATDAPEKEAIGLQKQGNKIGLAVGLSVGIPALLLALVGVLYQIRMHKRHAELHSQMLVPLSSGPQPQGASSTIPSSTSANANQQASMSHAPQQLQQNPRSGSARDVE